MSSNAFSVGQCVMAACTLEVTIPKPGNVHRSADFADTSLQDFLLSAIAIGPIMDRADELTLGALVRQSVEATLQVTQQNTNLGMILLLAPLASVACANPEALSTVGINEFLQKTTASDCREIFQGIVLANPGGIGQVEDFDVRKTEYPSHILEAMRLAESRDFIAYQYTHGFCEVIDFVWPEIRNLLRQGQTLSNAVIQTHLKLMHRFPDSLIARKNGSAVADQSAARAGHVLSAGNVGDTEWLKAVSDFDFWLRADGNRRNPGTTADLIAAGLFLGLVHREIDLKGVKF